MRSHLTSPCKGEAAAESQPLPLFRREVVDRLAQRSFGSVVLARPISHWALVWLFAAVALGLVAFFAAFSYTRKAQVPGVLLPSQGVLRIVATQGGTVIERRVREGQTVHAGDVLFVLGSERSSALMGNAEQSISTLLRDRRDSLVTEQGQLRQQAAQRADALVRRLDDLHAEARRIEQQITLQQHRVDIAEQTRKRYADLQKDNFISPVQVQDKEAELLDQQQRLADLQRAKSAVERDLASAEADLRDQRLQAERDLESVRRNASAVQQDLTENEARREILVCAPGAGVVSAITPDVGQTVGINQVLLSLLPAGSELEAELYAPSRAAGFLKTGMPVQIRYQSFSFQKFGQAHGTIREMSTVAMRPDEMPALGSVMVGSIVAEPLYRVRVKLDKQSVSAYGSEQALRAGTALEASILLEHRRLYEWVLDPLYAVTGRL